MGDPDLSRIEAVGLCSRPTSVSTARVAAAVSRPVRFVHEAVPKPVDISTMYSGFAKQVWIVLGPTPASSAA